MSKLDELIREIQNELGADLRYIGIAGTDGLPIAQLNMVDVDTDAVAARYALIAKLSQKVSDKLKLGDVEDNLISLDSAYSMVHMLGNGSYYAFLGFHKDAPIGVFRMVMKEYSEKLWDAIPR